ncbi:MAG: T9SS type A sorting domain-containing protein [Candidatus Fermentibacteraceae bacterium]|nr:T9SS type A sorting domain-containing protein [Candidatus Fermentibacteraceae bacterium]MBN2608841.1 T9SS type A sorting domain-containing protein [Candidatus Fermentibacteraceae bacterium]
MRYFVLLCMVVTASVALGDVVFRAENPVEEVVLLESTDESRLIQFNLQALEALDVILEEFGPGTIFRNPTGSDYMAIIGSPDLPVIRRMVLVPNMGNVQVEIVSQDTQYLGLYSVAPYQAPPTYTGGQGPYRINNELYGTSQTFPASPVEIESVNILRDIRVARVRYSPVSVNPVTGEVFVTTSVTARIEGTGGTGENELIRCAQGFTRSFLGMYDEVLGMVPVTDADVIDGSYVFIGSEESIDLAQDLIDWKAQKGYQVETGLISEIGGTPAAIDAWLEDAYNTWPNPPEYVMLVGGDNVVETPQYGGHAADNVYAVVGSGALPSMHIGRICGNDTDDLAYISWKLVQHEMNPYQPAGENWFMRGFSMACTDFEAPQEALRIHQLFQAHAIVSDFYCSAMGGSPPSLSQVVADINEGRSVISYIGHGNPTTWITTGFSNSNIASLTNGRRMPWVYTIGCQNGEFDNYYCICEAFLSEGTVANPRGAITIMGSSTNTPVGPGDTLQVHTFRGYFTEELHHLGAAHTWGKIKCDQYFGGSGADMIMMAHLFGDPETAIYNDTSPIALLTNTHAATIGTGNFTVTVTDDSKAPVEGATVAAYYPDTGELLGSEHTNSSGIATLSITSIPGPEQVTITSTAYSMAPAITYASPSVGTGEGETWALPVLYLHTPCPNPVTGTASIEFGIPAAQDADIAIYDLSGRVVTSLRPGVLQAGSHSIQWGCISDSGEPVPNGVYFLKLATPSAGTITRMFVVAR